MLHISFDCHVNLDDKVDRFPAEVNVDNERKEHAVLDAKFTRLQEACCRARVRVFMSVINEVGFAVERVLAPVSRDVLQPFVPVWRRDVKPTDKARSSLWCS